MNPQPQPSPDPEWDEEPTAVVNLEDPKRPGHVSLETHVAIMTGGRR